jgi:hypothetical protein
VSCVQVQARSGRQPGLKGFDQNKVRKYVSGLRIFRLQEWIQGMPRVLVASSSWGRLQAPIDGFLSGKDSVSGSLSIF